MDDKEPEAPAPPAAPPAGPGESEAAKAHRRHREDLLDEAIEESFPASDPPAIPRSAA